MLFNDNELSGSVIKLKSSSLRKGSKKPTNWKDRAKQLECQGKSLVDSAEQTLTDFDR
jgi:hypothetical protein